MNSEKKMNFENLLLRDHELYTIQVSREDAMRTRNRNEAVQESPVEGNNETFEVDMNADVQTDQDNETFEVDTNMDVQPNDNNSGSVMNGSTSFRWTHEAILLLLEEYKKQEKGIFSGKKSHKRAWQEIAETMNSKGYEVTGRQCQTRYDTMKRSYKNMKNHNNKSGNNRRQWRYSEVMESLLGQKPYVTPVSTISSTGIETSRISESSTSSTSGCNNDMDLPSTSNGQRAYKWKADSLSRLEKIEEERGRKLDQIIERMEKMDKKFDIFLQILNKCIDKL